jgi:protein O-GlcNAc transferase
VADSSPEIEALLAEGVRQQQAENFDAAERAYQAVLKLDTTQPQALALLGMIKGMFGEFQAAIDFFLKALERDPDNADLYNNLGETYRHLGDAAKALPCFAKAIELRPDLLFAYRGAADMALAAHDEAGNPEHARELTRLAVQHLRTLGGILRKKRHPDALGVLQEALALDPFDFETLHSLGNGLYEHGLLSESVEMFHRAIALRPDDANVFSNLGTSLYCLRRWQEADDAFRRALELNPEHKIARANRITCALMHPLYEDDVTPEQIYREHRAWGLKITGDLAGIAAAESKPFPNSRDPNRRLRVAFISGDLRDHPVAHFFRPLLASYDRDSLDVYCYTEQERTDTYTETLRHVGGTWRVSPVGDPDTALRAQLRADAIDIAIELSGQTAGTRLSALAVRAAPVTASWLGYPATTGLPTVDWRITDALVDPPGHEAYYTEKLMRLPEGFLCYAPRAENPPPVAPLPATIRGTITFGSFNNTLKLTASSIRCWAAILASVPRSRLVLKAAYLADPTVRLFIVEQFNAAGIESGRVELRTQVAELGDHLGTYGEIDIGLDPLVYNGTTTTCEALWMGVPVISLIGDHHAARVGFDLLSRVGLGELAGANVTSYVANAVALANDVPRLQRIRYELRHRMMTSPLCNAPRFARHFEAGLRAMWKTWCAEAKD